MGSKERMGGDVEKNVGEEGINSQLWESTDGVVVCSSQRDFSLRKLVVLPEGR